MNGLYRHFQQYVSNIKSASAPIHAFMEFLKPVLGTIFYVSHWLLFHITIVETTDSCGRKKLNPATMIIINPSKEYWASRGWNQRPPVLLFYQVSQGAWLGKWL